MAKVQGQIRRIETSNTIIARPV